MLKKTNKNLVLVTGVFDVLHQEHVNFLRKAKNLGDKLIIGIESDVRVKKLKGKGRPINSEEIRMQNLKNFNLAEEIFVLPENMDERKTQEAVIAKIRPDYLAVSSHTPHLKEKKEIIEKFGGKLAVVHEKNPAISTTKLLNKI